MIIFYNFFYSLYGEDERPKTTTKLTKICI